RAPFRARPGPDAGPSVVATPPVPARPAGVDPRAHPGASGAEAAERAATTAEAARRVDRAPAGPVAATAAVAACSAAAPMPAAVRVATAAVAAFRGPGAMRPWPGSRRLSGTSTSARRVQPAAPERWATAVAVEAAASRPAR